MAVEHVLSSSADDAVIRGPCRTCLACRRARSAGGPIAEATVRTDSASRRYGLDSVAFSFVIRVLGKTRLAGNTSTGPVRTLGTAELTY